MMASSALEVPDKGAQLLHQGPALRVFGSFAGLGEAQKRAAAEFLLVLRKLLQGGAMLSFATRLLAFRSLDRL